MGDQGLTGKTLPKPKGAGANVTKRDTDVTKQYHFGYTVAEANVSNAPAIELVYDGKRIDAADVKNIPKHHRHRISRLPIMRLRANSWVLADEILGPMIVRRLRRVWQFALDAAEQPTDEGKALKMRIQLMYEVSKPSTLRLKGLDDETRSAVLSNLGFDETRVAVIVSAKMDEVPIDARIVPDIPLCQGTVNIAYLESLADDAPDEQVEALAVEVASHESSLLT